MKILLPFVILGLVSCTGYSEADERAIRTVLAEQESAWDRGDIPGFMEGYAEEICFFSRQGRTCGKQQVTDNYLKSYPNKEAMGNLAFTIHEVAPVGDDHAWVAGLWELRRTADTLDGGFSLLWQRQAEGWRILRDHSY